MQFRTGFDLEKAIWNRQSSGDQLVKRFRGKSDDFRGDVKALISQPGTDRPDTKIGGALFDQFARELDRLGIGHEGLVFLSSVDTKVDAFYWTDGIIFLPSLFPHLVTVDAFNISPRELLSLRRVWIDSFEGDYSNEQFQTDLFLYKNGLSKWRKENKNLSNEGFPLFKLPDFRQFTTRGRPRNHFILTPIDIGTYSRRRDFARLVGRYFAEVFGQKTA